MKYRQTFMRSVTPSNDRKISATPQPMQMPRWTIIVVSMVSAELPSLASCSRRAMLPGDDSFRDLQAASELAFFCAHHIFIDNILH